MGFLAAAMPLISIGTTLAGGAMGAYGAMENASVQSQIAKNNANTAAWNANLVGQQGEQAATQKGMQTAQTVGKIRTSFGGSGIDVNSGSAADVQAAAEAAGNTDQQTIKSDSARKAWGYMTESSNFENQADVDTEQGNWGALSSLLGSASSAAKGWMQYGNSGGGSGSKGFDDGSMWAGMGA